MDLKGPKLTPAPIIKGLQKTGFIKLTPAPIIKGLQKTGFIKLTPAPITKGLQKTGFIYFFGLNGKHSYTIISHRNALWVKSSNKTS